MKKIDTVNKSIEILKNFVQHVNIGKNDAHALPVDADILANMARITLQVNASNGNTYWYYEPQLVQEIPTIREIFLRNGVKTYFHRSKLLYGQPILRVRWSDIDKNQDVKNFINVIHYKMNGRSL